METIRLLIALAAQSKWRIYQMDVKSTFLNGVLEEEVYIEQPLGYLKEDGEGKILKLKKAYFNLPFSFNNIIRLSYIKYKLAVMKLPF
jgi:Reverse transcriptase (RNA-dependent DNA polymerase)